VNPRFEKNVKRGIIVLYLRRRPAKCLSKGAAMDKRHSGKKIDVLLLAFFFVMVLLLIWVATAEGPKGNYYAYVFGYGNTITMMDRQVADMFSKELRTEITPGVHLMNKEGELVSPVLGGLKMALKGLLGGGRELEVGLSGVRVGLKSSSLGIPVLLILPLLLIGLIGYRVIRSNVERKEP
jgi:hypothetical protein